MGDAKGGSGNFANWTEGPWKSSGSSTNVRSCRESDLIDDERRRGGTGERVAGFGLWAVGFVPDRLRNESVGVALVVTIDGGCVLLLSWAADNEGRNSFRGVVVPLTGMEASDVISSPLAEGPAEEKLEPLADFVSVDALPLRFRLKYFSIASASRSRIRVAIGDNAAAGFGNGCVWEGPGDDTENVPVLLAEDMFPEVDG